MCLLLLLLLLHQAAAHKGHWVSQAAARWLAGGGVLISEREGENLRLLLKKLGLFNNYWYVTQQATHCRRAAACHANITGAHEHGTLYLIDHTRCTPGCVLLAALGSLQLVGQRAPQSCLLQSQISQASRGASKLCISFNGRCLIACLHETVNFDFG